MITPKKQGNGVWIVIGIFLLLVTLAAIKTNGGLGPK